MTKPEIKKLDDIVRKKCIDANLLCQVCYKTTTLQVHHYIGRRNRATRWVMGNLFCVCSGCHTLRRDSFHQDPMWGMEHARQIRGGFWPVWEDKMIALKNMINKFDYEQNLEMIDWPIEQILDRYRLTGAYDLLTGV